MRRILLGLGFGALLFWMGCSGSPEPVHYPTTVSRKAYEEKLLMANRQLVLNVADSIGAVVRQKQWTMSEQGRGIWFQGIELHAGPKIKKDDVIELQYRVCALDGYCYYSSDSLGPKQFKVGQGGVETGLEDAVLLLASGDSARVILPPHLAHGLVGDGDRIPPRAIIVYELRVRALKTGAN